MAIFSRIVAVATLATFIFAESAYASAADNYVVAAHRARNHEYHHERAARAMNIGSQRKRGDAKRCPSKPSTSSLPPATTVPVSTAVTTSVAATTDPENHHRPTTTQHHVTTSTKKASPPPATTSVASSGGGGSQTLDTAVASPNGKKVLAWGGSPSQLDLIQGNGVVAIYNWGAKPQVPDGMFGICQLWGYKNLAAFRQVRSGCKHLMGMNEINLGAQSAMSGAEAAALWKAEIQPYASGRVLIAPSVTTASSGFQYLHDFSNACGGNMCGAQVMQAHVYDTDPQKVISYVQQMHSTFGLPVFLSEFACQAFYGNNQNCNTAEATTYIQTITKWCYGTDICWGLAPFGFMDDLGNVAQSNALLSGSHLTSLGSWFVNYSG